MSRSRSEKLRLLAAHEAAAKALRDDLVAEARREVEENGTAPTWRLPHGRITTALTRNRVEIVDQDAFMDWLFQQHPTEVVERTVREVRNPAWLRRELEEMAAETPELADGIPGLVFVKGGEYRSTSFTLETDVKELMRNAAALYAAGAPAGAAMLGLDGSVK